MVAISVQGLGRKVSSCPSGIPKIRSRTERIQSSSSRTPGTPSSKVLPLVADFVCVTLSAALIISCYYGHPFLRSPHGPATGLPSVSTPVASSSSLVATRLLLTTRAPERRLTQSLQGQKPAKVPEWAASVPQMTIFCAPKPYTGEKDDPQRRALLSWLRLRPQPHIVLLGMDPSFHALAEEFPGVVSVEQDIDYNFYGVPLFHSMLARAQAAETPLSMIINGDIILLSDLMPVVGRIHNSFEQYLITAARWDVVQDFPYSAELSEWREGAPMSPEREQEMRDYVREQGSLHSYGGVDFWLWNNSPMPLFAGHMPPFAFGRGKYDNWLTHEAITSGVRQVIDASTALISIHVAHSYAHVQATTVAKSGSFWSTRKKSSWELFANIHMAEKHGSYTNQKGTALHIPWKLMKCEEPDSLNICLVKRERPANCSCEYSPYVKKTQSDPKVHKSGDFWVCGVVSVDKKKDYVINAVAKPNGTAGLPHTMDQVLPQVAKEVDGLKVVILVAVTVGYSQMLMNFACNLRKLGLASNLVVAALDEELYQFAFLQGLAVYYEQPQINMKNIDSSSCAFGSTCFRQFTKLKSRAVLRVLKQGYSVLWTDVDIVWFKDPLPDLMSYGPGTFPIQSNEPNGTKAGTGIRRINSGFYFARADPMTVQAFEAIVAHAALTKLSEQPSFYDILCGEKGQLLLQGTNEEACRWTNGLKTIFLDRQRYPNGAVHSFWNATNVASACSGCTILHNNWISGKEAKKDRVVQNGFWWYDVDRQMCTWSWSARLPQPVLAAEGTAATITT